MPGERKSVEPMAAITAPGRTAAQHQSLLHFVGQGAWSDDAVLTKVRQMVLPQITRDGPIEAWIIDDTGIAKKGQHSVGVSHQYCGQLGKQASLAVLTQRIPQLRLDQAPEIIGASGIRRVNAMRVSWQV
jgi:SRSO17 transposase